jgi:hypothetical protein
MLDLVNISSFEISSAPEITLGLLVLWLLTQMSPTTVTLPETPPNSYGISQHPMLTPPLRVMCLQYSHCILPTPSSNSAFSIGVLIKGNWRKE